MKLTEAELDHSIAADQRREEYWRDYDGVPSQEMLWTLRVAVGASILLCLCTFALFVMWLQDAAT